MTAIYDPGIVTWLQGFLKENVETLYVVATTPGEHYWHLTSKA